MSELNDNSNPGIQLKRNSRVWWDSQRIKYNIGLFIAGGVVFILYIFLGTSLISPNDETFEITFFTITLQIVGYLFLMLIANILYGFASFLDVRMNKNENEKLRKQLFQIVFWVSVLLPFLIPLRLLIVYFTLYS